MHIFEQANLGTAPFHVVGYERKTFRAHPGAPEQVGASCDYCSTGIKDVYWIQSSDKRRFKVGCDCVAKTGDRGLIDTVKREAKKAKAAAQAQLIHEARVILEGNPDLLANTDHPSIKGKSGRDYAIWILSHAGTSGKLKVAKIIRKAAGL